jgi:hypothetical protein
VCGEAKNWEVRRRLSRMDREQLKDELRRHAEEMVEEMGEKMPESLRQFGEVERAVKQATEELQAKLLQSWCDQAKDDCSAPRCPHCGRKMRQKEQKGKHVICHGGDVVVKRKRWWCGECGESFFPSGRGGDGGGSADQP